MSNVGMPLLPQDLINKVQLGTLLNDLRMQRLQQQAPILPSVPAPNVTDLLAAKTAGESSLNSLLQDPPPSDVDKKILDLFTPRNKSVVLEGIGGLPNTGTTLTLGKPKKPKPDYGLGGVASDILLAKLDPVPIVQFGYWPYGMSHWGYEQKSGWLYAKYGPYMHEPFTRDRMAVAQTMLREMYARGKGPNFPV